MPDRSWYLVGTRKVPHAERDVFRSVLGSNPGERFYDILGADTDDDDAQFPVGSDCAYAVLLTGSEAAELAKAGNCRYVEPDQKMRLLGAESTPRERTLTWMGATFPTAYRWHGQDVNVAVIDSGTTTAMRTVMGHTLVARAVFGGTPSGEIHPGVIHGCLVASVAVPRYGRLIDAMVTNADSSISIAAVAAAIVWSVNQGAQVVNISLGGGGFTSQAMYDAFVYASSFDCEFYCAAGNDGVLGLVYPAGYCTSLTKVHAVIAFDEVTNARWPGSSYSPAAMCCAPGYIVNSITDTGAVEGTFYGTSAAAPDAVHVHAKLMSLRRYSSRAAAAALAANTRDLGLGAEQGGGAIDLGRALTALGGFTAPTRPQPTPIAALNRRAMR